MNARDALKVLGRALGNIGDEGYNVTHASLALTVLTELVERAGEPVACDAIPAHEWETLSVEASEYDSSLEHAWKRCVRCGTRVHVTRDTLPPTAPGASHER